MHTLERPCLNRSGNLRDFALAIFVRADFLVDTVAEHEVVRLYRDNDWWSAEKPMQLLAALRGSHALVTARITSELVGIGNAISDGHLFVYFAHMHVLPRLHGHGSGGR